MGPTRIALLATLALLSAACASRPKTVASAPPPGLSVPDLPMPAGASVGMAIPARLPDGSYATPNAALSAAAVTWHFRAALNVAALACRGAQEPAMVAGYNAMLTAQKSPLAAAQATLMAQYRAGGGDWQDRYDDAMTRLYNYFAQGFAHDAFCARAGMLLDRVPLVAPADFPAFANAQLLTLDRPFTDFYRAYDRWRAAQFARPVIALAAPATEIAPPPRLTVDMNCLDD